MPPRSQALPLATRNSRFPEISPAKHRREKGTMKSYVQIGIATPLTGFDLVGQRPVPGQEIHMFPCPVRNHANNIPDEFRSRAEATYVTAKA